MQIQERTYLADDIAALKTLLGEKGALPIVIFLSINLLEGCNEILKKCTHIVFDESGKTPLTNPYMLYLACHLFER